MSGIENRYHNAITERFSLIPRKNSFPHVRTSTRNYCNIYYIVKINSKPFSANCKPFSANRKWIYNKVV